MFDFLKKKTEQPRGMTLEEQEAIAAEMRKVMKGNFIRTTAKEYRKRGMNKVQAERAAELRYQEVMKKAKS